MNEVCISVASLADLEEILQLQRAAPQAAQWSSAIYEQIFSAPAGAPNGTPAGEGSARTATVLCARRLDRTIAFAVLSFLKIDEHTECELENLVVAADQRRTGVGARLVQAVIELCLQSGAACLHAEVRASNTAALCLYQKNKFFPLATRKAYYRQPEEDAIVLQWTSDKSPQLIPHGS